MNLRDAQISFVEPMPSVGQQRTFRSDAFPANKVLGAATLDRIRHGAYRVTLEGDSFRMPRPLPGADETATANTGQKA